MNVFLNGQKQAPGNFSCRSKTGEVDIPARLKESVVKIPSPETIPAPTAGESAVSHLPLPRIPCAAYRIQFNRSFTFKDAVRIAGYLHDLGVSDLYASPYFKARKGSLHGYDIVDHTALNPELGTIEDYTVMTGELRRYGMGHILDIVPNHMCIECPENRWWADVLENGEASPYAKYFDIDWSPMKEEMQNKILIPVLGDQYGKVLEEQELKLVFEEGAFYVCYFEHKFPLVPKSYDFILTQRLPSLQERLTEEHEDFVELLSIMTALKHLPPYTLTDPASIEERNREKEVIKRRLSVLYHESAGVRTHIDDNLKLFNGVRGDPESFDLLDELMNQQLYRLSHWRVATEEINYRRFFDINGLGAIRMENPDVFAAAHALVFTLIENGSVTGLRVDHPDGLYDPLEYFQRVQRGCFIHQLASLSPKGAEPPAEREMEGLYNRAIVDNPEYKPFYIIGEKILTKSERMPADWPIFSTTGYVFLNSVNGIFVDGEQAKAFDRIYEKFIRRKIYFQDIVYDRKKLVIQVAMASEVNMLGRRLNGLSERNRHTRDFTLNSLRRVIIEVVASFPVYRTYIHSSHVSDRDKQYIELAVSRAKRRNPAINVTVFDFLKDVLLLRFPRHFSGRDRTEWLDFVMRFQQFSGPVMAKGFEDTALSVYNRLVSLNEVGGMPDRFGTALETFHGQNMERLKNWRHALITTSTHDTKRSEDVRARINVLSEIPQEWGKQVRNWAALNRKKKGAIDGDKAPDRNDEYLLYQTLVGAWPVGAMDGEAYERFVQRIRDYMLKEAREEKSNTSWINPDKTYEDALLSFIDGVLDTSTENPFLNEFIPFQRRISHFGMFNALSQTLLKIAAPGVPDFYQGTELWDYSLVDPDNRRPVDFDKRMRMLAELKRRESGTPLVELCRELSRDREDGGIMLYLVYKALNFRRANRVLFEDGEYLALEAEGIRSGNICAFERRKGDISVIAAVPRFLTRVVPDGISLPFGSVWENTCLVLAGPYSGGRYRNVFTGETVPEVAEIGGKNVLPFSSIFASFPVALLEKE